MAISPVGKNILVKEALQEIVTASGLHFVAKDTDYRAIKKGIILKSGDACEHRLKRNAMVLFKDVSNSKYTDSDKQTYFILPEDAIIAVVED